MTLCLAITGGGFVLNLVVVVFIVSRMVSVALRALATPAPGMPTAFPYPYPFAQPA